MLTFLCCLLILLTGCGGDLVESGEPVTISFLAPGTPDSFALLVEAFEEQHENVTIELVTDPISGLEDLTAADVTFTYQIWLQEMIDQGYPVSLNAFITEDEAFSLDDFYTGTVDALSVQGRVWAVPYLAEMIVMAYNRDLFDAYRVPYPDHDWSWDDFLATAQRLTQPEDDVYGYAPAAADGDLGAIEGLLWIRQAGGRLYDNLMAPTTVTFNDPRNVAALEWYSDLIYRHEVAPLPGDRQMPYPSAGIDSGVYGMWLASLSQDWDWLNVGRVPVPRGESAVTFGTVVGLMISAEAEDPKACWEFVSFLSENGPPALMPARRSLAEVGATGTLPPGAAEVARASLPSLSAFAPTTQGDLDSDWLTVMAALGEAMARIQQGEPAETVLDDVQASTDF